MAMMTTDTSGSSSDSPFGGNLPTFETLLATDKQPATKKRKRSHPSIESKETAAVTIGAPVSISSSIPIQAQQQLRASTYLSDDVRKRLNSGLHVYLHPNPEISKMIINLSPTYTVVSQAGFIKWVSAEDLVAITRLCGLCLRDDTDVEFSSTGACVNMRISKFKEETHRIAFDAVHASESASDFTDNGDAYAISLALLQLMTPTQRMLFNLKEHAVRHKEPDGITPNITTRILHIDHKQNETEIKFDDKDAIEKAARLILEIRGWRTANLLQLRLFRSIHPHHVDRIRWCKDVIQVEVLNYLNPKDKVFVTVHPNYMQS
jgi:hypothetical protein